jgi:hypothetical protein
MPWSRQVRIPLDRGGVTVVPAFPTAEEQLWSFVAQDGAEMGGEWSDLAMGGGTWNGYQEVKVPQDHWLAVLLGDAEPAENGQEENGEDTDEPTYWVPGIFQFWGILRWFVDTSGPWEATGIDPDTEFWIKCTTERWLDLLLRWWDGAGKIVEPRNCALEVKLKEMKKEREDKEWERLEERHAEKEKLRDAWNSVMNREGRSRNGDFIYDEDDETGQWAREFLGGMGVGFW